MSDETKRDILDELVDAIAATDLEGDMLASSTFADAHFEISTLRARVEAADNLANAAEARFKEWTRDTYEEMRLAIDHYRALAPAAPSHDTYSIPAIPIDPESDRIANEAFAAAKSGEGREHGPLCARSDCYPSDEENG